MEIFVLILLGISYVSARQERFEYHYYCPKDFVNIGRRCYHFNANNATWFQSHYACHNLNNSNLTTFSTHQDLVQFQTYLFKNKQKFKGRNPAYWVGGFKDWKQKKWIYTDASDIKFMTIHETKNDSWTCLLIDIDKKRWQAGNCMQSIPYICDTEPKAFIEFKVIDNRPEKKITLEECQQSYQIRTKKQKKRCWKLKQRLQANRPAAVIQKAKPGYQSKPTTIKTSVICPQNWMILGNQCYLFSREKASWSDAHYNCLHLNAKLAVVRSKVQDKRLKIFLNGFTEKEERWIGAKYNVKTKEWIWALSGNKLKYHGFAGAVSMANLTDWQAIIMDPQYSYQWNYRNQIEKHKYLCQVKGRVVKKLNPPRGTTIEITSHPRDTVRSRVNKRANRKKRH